MRAISVWMKWLRVSYTKPIMSYNLLTYYMGKDIRALIDLGHQQKHQSVKTHKQDKVQLL